MSKAKTFQVKVNVLGTDKFVLVSARTKGEAARCAKAHFENEAAARGEWLNVGGVEAELVK